MPNDPVLRSAAELLAYIYDDIFLCPLSEERELLLSAGGKSAEAFFDICQSVFGVNTNIAFRKICVYMANYCDSLLDHADELFQESNVSTIIDNTNVNIAAVEYIAQYAPIDSIEEKACLDSLADHSRFCYNHLKKRYRAYIQSLKANRV